MTDVRVGQVWEFVGSDNTSASIKDMLVGAHCYVIRPNEENDAGEDSWVMAPVEYVAPRHRGRVLYMHHTARVTGQWKLIPPREAPCPNSSCQRVNDVGRNCYWCGTLVA
jgi:hypothetical protein